MEIKLNATDEELLAKFKNLKIRSDLADLLEISYRYLIYSFYRQPLSNHYKTFTLKKKSGEDRVIDAPISSLKIIQRKLSYIFYLLYQPKPSAHGFVLKRNIVSNAQLHIRKRYVFNIDLEDFFSIINFGRIRGMFIAKPYNLSLQIATTLAQICCYKGRLPQGAPTSPILSNMICAKLDGELQRLAKRYNLMYTRYGDDISFSSTSRKFPTQIADFNLSDDRLLVKPGDLLNEIIESNGFKINQKKVRLQFRTTRQEVTGLTVNEITNVKRRFVRQIRAMLHAWEKFGYEEAQKEFNAKYHKKQKNPSSSLPPFWRVVEGKLGFLKMVRGEKDPIFRKLKNRFNKLTGIPFQYFSSPHEEICAALWVLESEQEGKQGTGFILAGFGLVTCKHVLVRGLKAFRSDNITKQYSVSIIAENDELDLAILKIELDNLPYLKRGNPESLKQGDSVTVAGFPGYALGDTPNIIEAKISAFKQRHALKRIIIDMPMVQGNSGGPVLNKANEVIGVAVTGNKSFEDIKHVEYGVIPISALNYLIKKV